MIKLLIDCDTGVDDSIALLFALHRKDVEVMGISTSIWNVTAAQAADNTMRVLKLAGKEGQVPVCVGAEKPMVGTWEDFPDFIHGKTDFEKSNFRNLPRNRWIWTYVISCMKRRVRRMEKLFWSRLAG